MVRGIIFFAALAAAAAAATVAATAQPLVLDGEQIADAGLLAAARKEGKIVLFGVLPETSMDHVKDGFKKDTGLDIDYVRLTTQRMHPRVLAEHAAGKLDADIVDLTDLPLIQDLVEKGVLTREHKVPSFDKLPAAVKDAKGRWYSMFRPSSTITINSARVAAAEEPKAWVDALDPRWQGRIGMPTIDAGGSTFTMFTYLRDKVAADYWKRLAVQKPRIYPSIVMAAQDLARGEISLVLGGADSMFGQIKEGAPLKVLSLAEGLSAFPISGGITTNARRANAAALYLNWVTSRRGGLAVIRGGAYAAHPEVPAPSPLGVQLPPLEKLWNIDPDYWTRMREAYSVEWRTTFGQR